MSNKDRVYDIENYIIVVGDKEDINDFKKSIFEPCSNNSLELDKLVPIPDRYATERKDRLSSDNVLWRVDNWGSVKETAHAEVLVDNRDMNGRGNYEFCFTVKTRGKNNKLTPYLIELARLANSFNLSIEVSFKNSDGSFGGSAEIINDSDLIIKRWDSNIISLR